MAVPANARPYRFRPKREFKRGFWWTLGAVFAYAMVAGGAALALAYLHRDETGGEGMPLGAIEQTDTCATGACPGAWAR